jgi:plastocyanin
LLTASLVARAGSSSPGGTIEGSIEGLGKGPFVVYVERIDGAKYAPAQPPAVMNQRRNTYLPHVLPVVAGTSVAFHSEDPELHNVYAWALALKRVLFNVAIPPKAPDNVQSFNKEGVVKLTCNVHKEMLAYVVVLQNPHFVLTEKGAAQFRIEGVPAGSLAVRVWGEKLDDAALALRFPVTVTEGGTSRIALAKEGGSL